MIKNDLNTYFFNDQYNGPLVTQFLVTMNHRLYNTSLDQQKILQDISIHSGKMSDFSINIDFNNKFKLPVKTYNSGLIKKRIIPEYIEKEFVHKYGYNNLISFMEIIKDSKIFTKNYMLYIDKYVFLMAYIVITHDGIVIVIRTDNGINDDTMKELITNDSKWSLIINQKSDYFYGYRSRDVMFTNDTIKLSNFSEKYKYNKDDKTDNWNIFLSSSAQNPNLLVHSTAKMKGSGNDQYFQISSELKNLVFQNNNNVKAYAFNNYTKTGFGKFISDGVNSPIFQIPFDKNPINKDNIIVWRYDKINDTLIETLKNDIVHHYPNIYDFRNMWNGVDDLYVEWYERSPTNVAFDHNFKDYINCYNDSYISMIINQTAPDEILNYIPMDNYKFDYDDYVESEWYGDIRAYKLSKLISLFHDNPFRYKIFMRHIYSLIKKYKTMTYTKDSHPQVFSRSQMTTSSECNGVESHIYNFTENHTYIKVYNRLLKNRMFAVYVNGARVPITHIMNYGFNSYVYFARKYITDESIIVLDVPMFSDMDEPIQKHIYYNSIETELVFPDPDSFGYISDADIVFHDKNSGYYIKNNNFEYKYGVDSYYINHETLKETYLDDREYLVVKEDDIFSPINADLFVLKGDKEYLDIPKGKPFYKRLDAADVRIKTNNHFNLHRLLTVSNCSIYQYGTSVDVTNNNIITISNFKGKPTVDRFRLFVGGVLLKKSQYSLTVPNEYEGNVVAMILSYPSTSRKDVLIEHLSYDEDLLFDGIPTPSLYKNGILYLDSVTNRSLNIDLCKIYVNGYRISPNNIKYAGINDGIIIDNYNGGYITIYQQSMDPDVYHYTEAKNKMNINSIAKNDDIFSVYLKSIYSVD